LRKIILYIATSLDGFIAEKDGGLNWLENYPHIEGEDYGYSDVLAQTDTTLMGSGTYKIIEDFKGPFPYPDTKNYVFTRRELKSSHPVSFIKNETASFVADLKQQPGNAIWLIGGGKLNASLAKAGLIDEIILTQIPVFLGEGIPVFNGLEKPLNFAEQSWKTYPNGVVQFKGIIAKK
jgi:dihydrofolate reductase